MTATPRYRTARTPGFIEEVRTLEALSHMGNALERLSAAVDFEAFHPVLEDAMRNPAHKSPAGRRLHRPGADVQGPGLAADVRPLRRADGVPADGQDHLPGFRRRRNVRRRSRGADGISVPRGADLRRCALRGIPGQPRRHEPVVQGGGRLSRPRASATAATRTAG